MKTITLLTLVLAGFVAGCTKDDGSYGGTGAQDQTSAASESTTKQPDNTALNKRDHPGDTMTPGDQANNESDRELARKIRRAIMQNDQLSTTAKNIKIIANNGKVTLRGPVQSAQERDQIASIVQQQVQGGAFENQLEVKQQAQTP
jgi:osmotically-inducible protein OsmY